MAVLHLQVSTMSIEAARTKALILTSLLLLVEAGIVHALTHGSLTILLNESSARREISICSKLLRRVMHLKFCSLERLLLTNIIVHLNVTLHLLVLGRVLQHNLLLAWLLSKLSILHQQELFVGQIMRAWKNELARVMRGRLNLWRRIAWSLHRQIFWRSKHGSLDILICSNLLIQHDPVIHTFYHFVCGFDIRQRNLDLLLFKHDVAVFDLVRRNDLSNRINELSSQIPRHLYRTDND